MHHVDQMTEFFGGLGGGIHGVDGGGHGAYGGSSAAKVSAVGGCVGEAVEIVEAGGVLVVGFGFEGDEGVDLIVFFVFVVVVAAIVFELLFEE